MNKICSFCGNRNFKNKEVQYSYKHDGKYFIVNNVPCEECEYCGEQYFEAQALKKIEADFNRIYYSGKKSKREIQVPMKEFVDIESPRRAQ